MYDIVVVKNDGDPSKIDFDDMLYDNEYLLKNHLIQILKTEASIPDSDFVKIIREVMNHIADNEIEKVLEK